MDSKTRLSIRLTESEKEVVQYQAEEFGLNVSEYIRMIIKLESSTKIISAIEQQAKNVEKLIESISFDNERYGYNAYTEEGKEMFRQVAEVVDSLDKFYHIDGLKVLSEFLNSTSEAGLYLGTMLDKKIKLISKDE